MPPEPARTPAAVLICLPGAGDPASPKVLGRALCQRQLDLALHLGCRTVIAHGHGAMAELVALRHQAEAAGARFVQVNSLHALAGLIGPDDLLLVLQRSLLPESAQAIARLGQGPGLLVVSAGPGVRAGFERIDLDRAFAGAMILPASLLARLSALPEDGDPAPALLRIALQQRLPEQRLPDALIDGGEWAVLRAQDDAYAHAPGWIARAMGHAGEGEISRRLAQHALGRQLARSGEAGRLGPGLLAGAGVLALGALAAAWWQLAPLAFLALLLLVPVTEALVALARVRAAPLGTPGRWPQLRWLPDLTLLALAAVLSALGSAPSAPPAALFSAFVLLAALRLLDRRELPRQLAPLRDRGMLALALLLACVVLPPGLAVMLAGAGGLALNLAPWRGADGITRV